MQALQHNVGCLRSLDNEQLVAFLLLFNHPGVGILTDFTFKFREIIGDGHSMMLDDHFGLDPLLQTVNMDDEA